MGWKPHFDYKHIVYYDGSSSSIVDKTNQRNIDWENVKIGDRFVMIHPSKIGFSATYSWSHAFDITGYVDGFLKVSGIGFGGSFKLTDAENDKITIEANDKNSFEVGGGWSSDGKLKFNTSHVAEHFPQLNFDNIGDKIEPADNERFDVCIKTLGTYKIDNKQFLVFDSTIEEIRKILRESDFNIYDKRFVAYLIENFKVNKLEYPLEKIESLYVTKGYNKKAFSFYFKSDSSVEFFNDMKAREWEDENYEEWELDFDEKNKFFAL